MVVEHAAAGAESGMEALRGAVLTPGVHNYICSGRCALRAERTAMRCGRSAVDLPLHVVAGGGQTILILIKSIII